MKKIAAIQMTATDDVDHNLQKATQWIEEAAQGGAQFVMLPEDFGFIGKQDTDKLKIAEPFGQGVIQSALASVAQKHQIWLHGGSLPIRVPQDPNKVFNTSLIWDSQGQVVARYDKIHLFDVTLNEDAKHQYCESDVVFPGSKIVCVDTPVGVLGMSVCYDLRFPELYRVLTKAGANILLVPAAFTKVTGQAHWEVLLRARAIENFCFVIAANQVGTHANQKDTYGSTMVINPWGEILARMPEGEGVLMAEIELEDIKRHRQRIPALDNQRLTAGQLAEFISV